MPCCITERLLDIPHLPSEIPNKAVITSRR
uniref:Glycosyltransferase QUASIMODO1, putative n=1 Tax=Arundo donax TaxID=35708 RepID=A0A0A9DLH0_ARUDO